MPLQLWIKSFREHQWFSFVTASFKVDVLTSSTWESSSAWIQGHYWWDQLVKMWLCRTRMEMCTEDRWNNNAGRITAQATVICKLQRALELETLTYNSREEQAPETAQWNLTNECWTLRPWPCLQCQHALE